VAEIRLSNNLLIKNIAQKVGIKYYICNIDAWKMYSVKFKAEVLSACHAAQHIVHTLHPEAHTATTQRYF
jgi:hypothetical protein